MRTINVDLQKTLVADDKPVRARTSVGYGSWGDIGAVNSTRAHALGHKLSKL